MNFNSQKSSEENLLRTGNNGEYNLRPISIPVKNEDLTLKGFLTTPKNRSGYYYAVEHPKQRIVLHFTAGHILSDLGALTRNDWHVSVAFVIGRSGTIYQLFSSKFWSGHIGKGIGNTNTKNAQDKITIGIELSNYGFLTERDGNLETFYSRQKRQDGTRAPVDIYCSLSEEKAYKKIDAPFRGQSFYATYTGNQYDSLIILLRYLTAQYNIPRQFLPEPKRYQATDDVLSFKGIVSHVNYRPDGKWDIGPAFDWTRVIHGVQAAAFSSGFESVEPESTRGGTLESINSEDKLDEFLPEAKDQSLEDEPYEELPLDRDE